MKGMSWRRVGIVGAALVGVTALVWGGSAAVGADLPEDPPDISTFDRSLEPVESDDILDTLMMLQDAGINEIDSPFKGLTIVENRGDHLVVHVTQDIPESAAIVEAVEKVAAVSPVKVVVEYLKVSPAQVTDLAGQLADPTSSLVAQYGLSGVTGTTFDPFTGTVTVNVSETSNTRFAEPKTLAIEGVTVTIEVSKSSWSVSSRVNDGPNWSGAINLKHNAITSPSFTCGAGFNWNKNGSNEKMGSTAEHCFRETNVNNWYNYGSLVGSRYYYNVAADTFLIRSAGGLSRFNPNMFIGAANSTDIRTVHSAITANYFGQNTALNSSSGLKPARKIIREGVFASMWWGSVGPMMQQDTTSGPTQCPKGDSGGPLLQTRSTDGKIVAVGQLFGWQTIENVNGSFIDRCSYTSVALISSKLGATVYTG